MSGQFHFSAALIPSKLFPVPTLDRLVGAQIRLDVMTKRKIPPIAGNRTPVVQTIASHLTD
jgi:hypothetical protein